MNHQKGSRSHAYRCSLPGCCWATEPQLFMCLTHWRKVPADMQRDVWGAYRALPDRAPTRAMLMQSRAWVKAADVALAHVATAQGLEPPTTFRDAMQRIQEQVQAMEAA